MARCTSGVATAGAACIVRVNAMHISDVQAFARKRVDIAVICTKSYDTEWAATMIAPYLSPQGCVVSMQNGINEERIARVVGWGRTMGTIVSTISVNAYKAGQRKHPSMRGIAASLSDKDIADLAAYYSAGHK